jgi:hypothetical protein
VPDESHLSQHPVDVLIRQLARLERQATAADVESIRGRVATARFLTSQSLAAHLTKRINEGQWAEVTTEHAYLGDLWRLAGAVPSRIGVCVRRGGNVALVLGSTSDAVPLERRGPRGGQRMLVVFSADWGRIVTGYQSDTLQEFAIPKETQWLG